MNDINDIQESDEALEKDAVINLEKSKELLNSFEFEEIKSGHWFIKLIALVVNSYDRNARAEYFKGKYPDHTPDEIANKLISVSARYGAIVGAIAGTTATAGQFTALTGAGIPLFLASIGVEMIEITRVQMRLVLELATVYDRPIDADDPEDMLMIFGYALGVFSSGNAGQAFRIPTQAFTKRFIRRHIAKDTLKMIQRWGRQIGVKILQRTIIKYAVPMISAAVGSSYNFILVRSTGQIAKRHFRGDDISKKRTPFSERANNFKQWASNREWKRPTLDFLKKVDPQIEIPVINCPACSYEYEIAFAFCPDCGAEQEQTLQTE